jgi:hypothetical protein
MSLVHDWDALKPSGAGVFVPLLIASVGTVLVISLFFLLPGFHPLEMLALLLAIAITAIGYTRRTLRGLISYAILYFASGVAASLYHAAAPSVAKALHSFSHPFSPAPVQLAYVSRGEYAFTYAALTLFVWALLEFLVRVALPDTQIPKLRFADNFGGVLTHLPVALVAASLLFNTMGYGGLRYPHDRAHFRDAFNQVLRVHYQTQSIWFPDDPPAIYVYDLDL